jgi:chromosome segregation ATPase
VKENINTRISTLRKSLREGSGAIIDLNKRVKTLKKLLREGNRLAVDLNKRINFLGKSLREGERSETDLKALHDVQTQIDSLIEELISTKLTITGLSIGGDDVYASNNAKVKRNGYIVN